MAKDNSIKVDIKRLIKIAGYFKNGFPSVKVGITGDKAQVKRASSEGKLTNAQIGFIHEFGKMTGKRKLPARSFLDMPLRLYLNKYLEVKKSTSGKAFEKALEDGKIEDFVKNVGFVAEEVIQDAFATSGFGNWEPNRPSTVKRKGSSMPLIDTGELRRSISSEVIK